MVAYMHIGKEPKHTENNTHPKKHILLHMFSKIISVPNSVIRICLCVSVNIKIKTIYNAAI